ncbi:hypothetical protein H2248_007129 [Termitomyces sp. 'cryptogamus']|nr:hypothetical protein H2248_007129 [Termitomyces sp. 'cryptogamus']
MTPKLAICEEHSSKPPLVTEGDLTPEVLQQYANYCVNYFQAKQISEPKMVWQVDTSFKDHCIHDWIAAKQAHIEIFLQGFCAGDQREIEAKMDAPLHHVYKKEGLKNEKEFQKWLEGIQVHDNAHHYVERCQREITNEAVHASKKPLLSSTKHNTANTVSVPTSSLSHHSAGKLLPLTAKECKLLMLNEQCFKCCYPFAGHLAKDCKNGFLDLSIYQMITQSVINAKKALCTHMSKLASVKASGAPLAAISAAATSS